MSNEDLYGTGFSDEESDDSVFEIQRLISGRDKAMEYAQKCEDDLKQYMEVPEQSHHKMSQLNLKYKRLYERAQELEAQNQMKDELLMQQANELQAKADEIIKLKADVAKFKAKLLPRCPPPRHKIPRGKSPSRSPRSPCSSSSCLSTPTGSRMKMLPPVPSPRGKIPHRLSPSPSLPSSSSSDSSSSTSTGSTMKKKPKTPLPPRPLKLNKGGNSNHYN